MMVFNVIYIYAAEYVPSKVRGFAVGMGSAASRLGGIATPYVVLFLHRGNLSSPYWFFAATCLIGSIAAFLLKPLGKHID